MKDTHMKPIAFRKPVDAEEEVRQRAYELFEARGGREGRELEDWLQAEEEIRGTRADAQAA
jgi:hypothetical protein